VSFIGNIVDKAVNFVHDVFDGDDEPKQAAPKPARSKDLAVDSKTTFGGGSSSDATSGGIMDTIRARVAQPSTPAASRSTTRTAVASTDVTALPPHLQFDRGTEPPRESTPVEAPAPTVARAAARTYDIHTGTADTQEAAIARANVQKGLDYYASTFGRQGLDGAGSGVDVLVNDRRTDGTGEEMFKGNGGYYALPDASGQLSEAIHFGVGKSYDGVRGLVEQASMGNADDLAIHELTHGIIRKETGHLGGDADEAGATNEGIADVMAAAATRDWRIGEGMYTAKSDYKLMRNIENPDDQTAIHGLWTSMDQVNAEKSAGRELEEHWASGVVSTAAQRVQSRFGGEDGWKVVENVFYDTIDNARLGDMSFQAVAGALRTSAAAVYGEGSSVDQVFDEELRRGGL
jgi:hypothetical protein